MDIEFTGNYREIVLELAISVDEVYVEDRKGVSQCKYVFQIEEGATYYDWTRDEVSKPVPEALVGFWMTKWACDTEYYSLKDRISKDTWVKCEHQEVKRMEWVEI